MTFGGTDYWNGQKQRCLIGAIEDNFSVSHVPGISGNYVLSTGVGGRPVIVRGFLPAASAAALTTLENALEALAKAASYGTLVDDWGRSILTCMFRQYRRIGPVEALSDGTVLQEFECEFYQMLP